MLFSVSDYESAQFLLTFPAGVRGPRSQCGSISVTDDILVEEDETVTVMAAFIQSSPEISLVSNTATIIITDNDCKDIVLVVICYTFHDPYNYTLYSYSISYNYLRNVNFTYASHREDPETHLSLTLFYTQLLVAKICTCMV